MNKILYFFNTSKLFKWLNETCLNENEMVSENEEIVEAIEVLFRRLSVYPLLSKSCLLAIHTGGGVRILLRILSSCNGDLAISEVVFQVLALLLKFDQKNTAVSIYLSGEQKVIKDIFDIRREDETLMLLGKYILKKLRESSAHASLEKIKLVKSVLGLGMTTSVYTGYVLSKGRDDYIYDLCQKNNESMCTRETDVMSVIVEMDRYSEHEDLQIQGLEIIYKYANDVDGLRCDGESIFCSEIFLKIMYVSIESANVHRQRLSLSMLMALTDEERTCEKLSKKDYFCSLLGLLLLKEGGLHNSLTQMLLWTLANCTKIDGCLKHLESNGLKSFLFQIITDNENVIDIREEGHHRHHHVYHVVVPVEIRLLYDESELKQASYFRIVKTQEDTANVPTEPKVLDILPRSKKNKPKYGTTSDGYINGDPGLI